MMLWVQIIPRPLSLLGCYVWDPDQLHIGEDSTTVEVEGRISEGSKRNWT